MATAGCPLKSNRTNRNRNRKRPGMSPILSVHRPANQRVTRGQGIGERQVQPHRDQRAAERFFRKLLHSQGSEPLRIITDQLRSYSAAMRSIFSNVTHSVERYANNRVEASHQPTRQRERQMRRFKSARHAQRFLSLHDAVRNLFRVGRHLLRSSNHRLLRSRSFAVWREVTAA